jgi:glycosyltransferase involved in cell wall biosynthesis
MKILLLSETYPYPPVTGHQVALYNFIRLLSEHHEITLLSFLEPREELSGTRVLELNKYCKLVKTFRMRTLERADLVANLLNRQPMSLRRYDNPDFVRALAEVRQKESYDLAHFYGFNMGQFGMLVPDLPKVFTPIDCTTLFYRRLACQASAAVLWRIYYAYQARKMRHYERAMGVQFDRNYVFAEEDRVEFSKLSPGAKVDVVPFGVNVPARTAGLSLGLDGPVLIFSGNMSVKANVESTLYFYNRIFPLIRQEIPAVNLVIAGSDPDRSLRDLEKKDKKVMVTGYVADLWSYIRAADVYVAPILSAVGIQARLLEAMVLGKAIVSTSQPMKVFRAVSGEQAMIADDPAGFARATIQLLQDNGLRERLGKAARELVENRFTWQTAVKKLEAIQAEAVSGWKSRK